MRETLAKREHTPEHPDLICFSHLRWNFVYQRPQHLLSRFAAQTRVFYVEEPVFVTGDSRTECTVTNSGVKLIVPYVSFSDEPIRTMRRLIDECLAEHQVQHYALWYYTPMHLPWTRQLQPLAVVYDCMDELSAFKGAPVEMKERELELMKWADLVFTGGLSLYEAKRHQHSGMYPFPSSIDVSHFVTARTAAIDPADQASITGIRLGFYGVIDERMDLDLLSAVAQARPNWQLILLGPVVKIDPARLPKLPNIHYLGMKTYEELPFYLAGWDIAMLPFARNESTRFISPTKTPEYLAAGLPVVSTSIQDVVRPYGHAGLVHIADTPQEFVAACERALAEDSTHRLRLVDALLSQTSWSQTWGRMSELLEDVIHRRTGSESPSRRHGTLATAAAAM